MAVSEVSGDAAVEFDEAVDGFGAAVAGAATVEVRQERGAPSFQRGAESADLGDRARDERGEDLLRDAAPFGEVRVALRGAELLRALPRDVDLDMGFIRGDGAGESGALAVGELVFAAAQGHADPVERVVAGEEFTRRASLGARRNRVPALDRRPDRGGPRCVVELREHLGSANQPCGA